MSEQAREKNLAAQARWRETHQEQRRIAAAKYNAKLRVELRAVRVACGRGDANRHQTANR